jgi:hypothetical protein
MLCTYVVVLREPSPESHLHQELRSSSTLSYDRGYVLGKVVSRLGTSHECSFSWIFKT